MRIRPPSGIGDILRWARDVTEAINQIFTQEAPNTLVSRTTRGTTRTMLPDPSANPEPAQGLIPRGRWNSGETYKAGDLVYVDEYTESDPIIHNESGTFVCLYDVGPSEVRPSADPLNWELYARAVWTDFQLGQGGGIKMFGDSGGIYGPPVTPLGPGIEMQHDEDTGIRISAEEIPYMTTLTNRVVKARVIEFSQANQIIPTLVGVERYRTIVLCSEPELVGSFTFSIPP